MSKPRSWNPTTIALAACLASSALAGPARAQSTEPPPQRSPILVTFDLHMDPMSNGSTGVALEQYESWSAAAEWLLGVTESRGAKLSFSTVGQYAEHCLADTADSFPLIQRLYESGGSVGTHSHDRTRTAAFQWAVTGRPATDEESAQVWADDVGMVDELVRQALGVSDAEVRSINNLRGTHLPTEAADRHELFLEYGFESAQAGPSEDFFGLFQHYMFHPYRSSAENELAEDRDSPMILTHAGPVIGSYGTHKGILQDMRMPQMQARFLAEVLNWLHDARTGAPDRVWCFGWGSHGSDMVEGGEARDLVEPMLDWLEAHFIGRRVAGGLLARYGSYAEEAEAYRVWEAANPDLASKAYASRDRDWSLYPWLAPVAAHLWGSAWVEVVQDDATAQVHRLEAPTELSGPYDIVVAFPCGATRITVDLSAIDAGPWMRIDPVTGAQSPCRAAVAPVPRIGAIFIPLRSCPTLDEQKARIEAAYPDLVD